jgi:hypothetical protein
MTRRAPPSSSEAETQPTSPADAARARAAQEERETMVSCPSCEGRGFVTLEVTATKHRGAACELCRSLGIVTVSVMRAFRLGQTTGKRPFVP